MLLQNVQMQAATEVK